MRSFFFFIPAAVLGCEIAWFTDELCSVASTGEVKETSMAGTAGEYKTTTKHEGQMAWIPGACLVLGTPVVLDSKADYAGAEAVKKETLCTFGLTGHGNYAASYIAYGKDMKACSDFTWKKEDEKDADGKKTYWAGKFNVTPNICSPNSGGRHTKMKDQTYFTRTTCGPVPAAVWGIVLGSLGIVFSFAGLGLAAAAGK